MPKIKSVSITVFLLFFGMALVQAIQRRSWPEAAIYLALGILALWADLRTVSNSRE